MLMLDFCMQKQNSFPCFESWKGVFLYDDSNSKLKKFEKEQEEVFFNLERIY